MLCLACNWGASAQDDLLRRAARLDSEHNCAEAERYYQQALAAGKPSSPLLNNLGNHYLECGQPDKAEDYFERLLKINPGHPNANLQLARIATERKQGAKALQHLSHVGESSPAIELLRAEASQYAGKSAAAGRILDGLEREAGGDARVLFALGISCARMGLYDRAVASFAAVLVKHPDDFDVVFHLGRAAVRARHYERAQRALEAALKLRPGDADVLLELGLVHASLEDYSRAVYLLAQARQHAPRRADILLALAHAAEDAGYYGDAALAYDEYVQVRPGDETARRDRGRVYGYTGTRLKDGLRELARYVEKHPEDPIGYFDLAQLTWTDSPQTALDQLSTALRLDPGFAPAHYARAWLLHRLGRMVDSLADLQAAVRLQPKNVRALDQLGLTCLALDKPAQAEKVLRQALAIAPGDPEVLLHLGRALISLDRPEEAQPFLDRFQKLRPYKTRGPLSEPGMIELATMSPAERARREIERLRRDARTHPGDPDLQMHLAGLLMANGQTGEADAAYHELLTSNADGRAWRQAGSTLLRAGDYKLAAEFLRRAAADIPAARLDLAIALFHTAGTQQALEVMDKVPEPEQDGDYLLMKARILAAAGRPAESENSLREGLRRSRSRPDVAQQAAYLLLAQERPAEALRIVQAAIKNNPDDPDLLLTYSILLGLSAEPGSAEQVVKKIESRWPEWDRAYLVHGLILERVMRTAEARQKIRTSVALGATGPAARCALARLDAQSAPDTGVRVTEVSAIWPFPSALDVQCAR